MESEAIVRMREMLGGGDCTTAKEIEQLWHEYEEGTSAEARLAKDLDKLEMILQVLVH